MNVQRRTPYLDIKAFRSPLTPCVMASFVSLFLRRETVELFGLPVREFFVWSDDWEYTRRISLKRQCYVAAQSRVVHAMNSNSVVNIATDTPERLSRYHYFYRNDVFLYRREGLCGWLWVLAKDCWHSVQALEHLRPSRLGIIWHGFAQGLRFSPPVEFIHKGGGA